MSEQDDVVVATPVDASSSRTVAIIKPHALDHRFEIEHRITEAKFEIVKERQMEFDVETDPETLFDLFGEDAPDPVLVAIVSFVPFTVSPETKTRSWALQTSKSAEIQIASLFVSRPLSPLGPPTGLLGLSPFRPVHPSRPLSSSLSPRRVPTSTSGHSAAGSSATNGTPQRTPFKAREIPFSHVSPSIVPRTTPPPICAQA
ncbi:hypothetical protein EDB85DRAFT_2139425 [Lactarius pseudohatsudake]|nr:hypothetical protein EDB85DRAFT_2139425 [Lactarius pseudohatsudake]